MIDWGRKLESNASILLHTQVATTINFDDCDNISFKFGLPNKFPPRLIVVL